LKHQRGECSSKETRPQTDQGCVNVNQSERHLEGVKNIAKQDKTRSLRDIRRAGGGGELGKRGEKGFVQKSSERTVQAETVRDWGEGGLTAGEREKEEFNNAPDLGEQDDSTDGKGKKFPAYRQRGSETSLLKLGTEEHEKKKKLRKRPTKNRVTKQRRGAHVGGKGGAHIENRGRRKTGARWAQKKLLKQQTHGWDGGGRERKDKEKVHVTVGKRGKSRNAMQLSTKRGEKLGGEPPVIKKSSVIKTLL